MPSNRRWNWVSLLGMGLWCLCLGSVSLWGCPFCAALSKSLREELSIVDHAAFAICERPAQVGDDFKIHSFRIERNLLGEQVQSGEVIEAYSARTYQSGDRILLLGIGKRPQLDWAPSDPLGPLAVDYIERVVEKDRRDKLLAASSPSAKVELDPADPADPDVTQLDKAANNQASETVDKADRLTSSGDEVGWLNLFWTHLESEEEWVRRDCFNAVAQASVANMRAWVKQLDADEVIRRLETKEVSIEHRRYYWTVLSLCGRTQDADYARDTIFHYLERDPQRLDKDSIGLDAAISCFVLLGGEAALEEVEQRILQNPDRLYADRYAAIVALRVHAVEFQVIETKRLARALSLALSEPAIADLVIPDLARMEDWTHVPRLLELYREAGQTQQYLRVPIVNYLRACPLPQAEQALEECRQIDPDAYRRASIIFPSVPQPSS